ncbi:DUF2782 domain-containing protein [Nitrosococcus watsonii]|uniref:DUF2782 domain-containing protein n=1 Tax=Nitrosococcus watsoni (strain C-113) TaxID=105559 RepID=D8KB13_NITWC|nr:DUF2782 domain-containing protein [Nitrosococcus watsonii]ADJ27547.1 conserved hypothetical protein [Nitrosococcus watsonii C-113]
MFILYPRVLIYLNFLWFLLVSAPAFSEEPEDLVPLPDLPSLPGQADTMEPEIKIIQKGENMIEEYRLNGKLYQIKVTPSIGPSYFLVDADGDGDFESRFEGPVNSDMLIPSWVIFRW